MNRFVSHRLEDVLDGLRLGKIPLDAPTLDTLFAGVELYNQGTITIGPRCVVSQRAHLCASTHDASDPDFALVVRPVVLRQACWIAAEAFVGPGVTMGEGAVLAARGALFEDAEPMTIYRGNPATAVRQRVLRTD